MPSDVHCKRYGYLQPFTDDFQGAVDVVCRIDVLFPFFHTAFRADDG